MRHIQDFAEFFFKENIFGFMYNDLDQAINSARIYFLVALGLSAYTEYMGGLVTGYLKDSRWSKKNYRAFLPYLGPHYVNLDRQIDLYKRVRCGLVHEYFVKGHSMISRKSTPKNIPGIVFTSIHDHITINVQSYFQDFKAGVQKYYDVLKGGNVEALRKFKRAVM